MVWISVSGKCRNRTEKPVASSASAPGIDEAAGAAAGDGRHVAVDLQQLEEIRQHLAVFRGGKDERATDAPADLREQRARRLGDASLGKRLQHKAGSSGVWHGAVKLSQTRKDGPRKRRKRRNRRKSAILPTNYTDHTNLGRTKAGPPLRRCLQIRVIRVIRRQIPSRGVVPREQLVIPSSDFERQRREKVRPRFSPFFVPFVYFVYFVDTLPATSPRAAAVASRRYGRARRGGRRR